MDFLHKKLLQASTKDQEDKIVDWMLAEAKLKQTSEKNIQNITSDKSKPASKETSMGTMKQNGKTQGNKAVDSYATMYNYIP